MDFDEELLKRIRIRQLEPALAREVIEFAQESGHESAITSQTSLGFLFKIYQSEKVKEKRSRRTLERAEDLIMKLSSLHHDVQQRENERRKEKSGTRHKIPVMERELELPISKRARELLSSIGIEDEKEVQKAVMTLGEEEIEERVELVHSASLGEELARKVFGEFPETLLVMPRDEFISELEAMESKKGVIDSWSKANEKLPEPWANYNVTPGILIDSYEDIERLLKLQLPESPPSSGKKEEIKYRGKPMDPDDFIRVVSAMGFSPIRQTKHGTMMRNEEGRITIVAKPHKAQMQLSNSTIKKNLTEAGVDLNEFEKKRREMDL